MDTFAQQIEAFKKKVEERARIVHANATTILQQNIIRDTPIKTGRAKANWQATIGAQASTSLYMENAESGTYEPEITATVERGKDELVYIGIDDTSYIGNCLTYIVKLEFDAWSLQAPNGMVRINTTSEIWNNLVIPEALAKTLAQVP